MCAVQNPVISQSAATAEPELTSTLAHHAASISPIELARSINHARRAQTDVELADTWRKLGLEAGSFEVCGSGCEAKVFRYELSSHTGPEVVLKLTQSFDICRYLIFGQAKDGGWKFLGHVDHDFNKYEMARQRIATVNGKPFLVSAAGRLRQRLRTLRRNLVRGQRQRSEAGAVTIRPTVTPTPGRRDLRDRSRRPIFRRLIESA